MANIVTVTSVDTPAFLAIVQKKEKTYLILKLQTDAVGCIHKDLLEDAVIIFGYSEERLREGMSMFQGYKEGGAKVLQPLQEVRGRCGGCDYWVPPGHQACNGDGSHPFIGHPSSES